MVDAEIEEEGVAQEEGEDVVEEEVVVVLEG